MLSSYLGGIQATDLHEHFVFVKSTVFSKSVLESGPLFGKKHIQMVKVVFAVNKFLRTYVLALTALAMTFGLGPSQAQPRHYTLTVVVTHMLPAAGHVKVAVFNSRSTFLKSPYIKKQTQAGQDGQTIVNFENIPAGDYAVSVILDENDDGKLDRNFIGKPREPFGFSNNVHVKFAPPAFDKAKFTVDEQDQTIVIDLNS